MHCYASCSSQAGAASWAALPWVFVAVDKTGQLLRSVTVKFTANICDDYTVMWGQMTATGFSGRYQFTGLMNVEERGAAYGARVMH